MNKWRRDARIYSLSWTKTARDVQHELLARIFFLFWGKNHAWRSRDIEYLVILNRFFFVLPFKQDSFPLELQARFFFLFSRKNLVCSTRIRGTLPDHPRQIRTWKERRQEHRLVQWSQCFFNRPVRKVQRCDDLLLVTQDKPLRHQSNNDVDKDEDLFFFQARICSMEERPSMFRVSDGLQIVFGQNVRRTSRASKAEETTESKDGTEKKTQVLLHQEWHENSIDQAKCHLHLT